MDPLSLTPAVIWEPARSPVLIGGTQGQPLAWRRNANAQLESTPPHTHPLLTVCHCLFTAEVSKPLLAGDTNR